MRPCASLGWPPWHTYGRYPTITDSGRPPPGADQVLPILRVALLHRLPGGESPSASRTCPSDKPCVVSNWLRPNSGPLRSPFPRRSLSPPPAPARGQAPSLGESSAESHAGRRSSTGVPSWTTPSHPLTFLNRPLPAVPLSRCHSEPALRTSGTGHAHVTPRNDSECLHGRLCIYVILYGQR
jgi:hypothetical protein